VLLDIGTGGNVLLFDVNNGNADVLLDDGIGRADVPLASVDMLPAGSAFTLASDGRAAAGRLEGLSVFPPAAWLRRGCRRSPLDGNAGA